MKSEEKELQAQKILFTLRTEKGVSQEILCKGLCKRSTYSRYESGKRKINKLLFTALLQRLGKDPDKFSIILSKEEYNYFVWRWNVLIAVGQGQMEELERLIVESENLENVIDEILHRQFRCWIESIVQKSKYQDYEQSERLLTEASNLTLPGIESFNLDKYLISIEEMYVLLELCEILIKREQKEKAFKLIFAIVEYTERAYNDNEAKGKIYPRAIRLVTPLLIENRRYIEGMHMCEKAINLLCWNGVLYDLTELLELYLACSENYIETETVTHYKKYYHALKEIYKEYDKEKKYQSKNMLCYCNHELYLVEEIIRYSRSVYKMSQEKLCEGVCTPETISRIETGKNIASTRCFHSIMEKLETDLDYYNGELDTEDFLMLEKMRKLTRFMSLHNWKDSRKVLEELKAGLDMTSYCNQRIITMKDKCLQFYERTITLEEFQHSCEKYLNCEKERWREEVFWNQFFTLDKVKIMNYLSICYHKANQLDKSIFILEHILRQLQNSKIWTLDRNRSWMLVICSLSSQYGEAGLFDKCIEICNMGIALCMQNGKGLKLGTLLGNKAEAINDKENKSTKISKHYLEQAYYVDDLFSVKNSLTYTDKYYRSHYDENVSWY